MSEARMRLFVALELPVSVRAALGDVAARLRPASGSGVRWTDPNGMHLTLKFIGEWEATRLDSVRGALGGIHAAQPIEAAFRGIGWFPNARHPRVLWAGVEAGSGLAALAEEIERALEPLGIPRESREFRPHLTLARIKDEARLEGLRREVERLGAPEFGRTSYAEFDLMESKLHPKGAVYTRVERFAFAASVPAAHAGEI
jgi:2'-5' RNA ligase